MTRTLVAPAISVLLAAAAANAPAQNETAPRAMWCGGNQLTPEGPLQASTVKGILEDGAGGVFPNGWIQIQTKGQTEVLLKKQTDDDGRFKVPRLRPGEYWLGVTAPGFNLHYWDLTVKPRSGTKFLRVVLTVGT